MKKIVMLVGMFVWAITAHAQYVEPKITHEPYGKQKVAYQLNDSNVDFQIQVLRNANNHIRAIGKDNIELHLVVFAGGMTALETSKPETVAALENLRAQGVKIAVCNNTLKARNVDWRSLNGVKETDIVPAGVAEIAYLQQKGFAYVRP